MREKIKELKEIYEKNKESALKDYYDFLKFQSISSEPEYHQEMYKCVNWLFLYLKNIGFDVKIWNPDHNPTLFASYEKAGLNQPTLLIYNHYDVQPVTPLDLWKSPPFEPTLVNEQVFARGAQDNKGQCFYVILALKALMERDGSLPINIKLCIEGEEESGSVVLSHLLKEKQVDLKADYLAVIDLGMINKDQPAITLGVRGIVTMDVEVEGTKSDLHSGFHGGIAFNPIHALISLLASLRDEKGKICVPHFYDDITPISTEELSHISLDFDEELYLNDFGAEPTGGEINRSPLERNWLRPTIEVNGITGGYSGDGFKTVIPSKASAKVSCRLVANQDPEKIKCLVSSFFKEKAPKGVRVSVHIHEGGGKAVKGSIDSKAVKAFSESYKEVFNKKCQYVYAGGSIPIITALAQASKAEVVMLGLGLGSDCIHAPNEHFSLDRIEKGFLATARALELMRIE